MSADADLADPRILNKDQIEPSSLLRLIPAPQVLLRIMVGVSAVILLIAHSQVLYRGIPDSELKEWNARGVGADMGVDWRET